MSIYRIDMIDGLPRAGDLVTEYETASDRSLSKPQDRQADGGGVMEGVRKIVASERYDMRFKHGRVMYKCTLECNRSVLAILT